MGSKIGTLKVAAKRLGLTLSEYQAKINSGYKHCWKCRTWRNKSMFGVNRSTYDRLMPVCTFCVRVKKKRSRSIVPPVDKKQAEAARSAVNYEIKKGVLAKPTSLPCLDCGAPADIYHHYSGYGKSHWFDIHSLCWICHNKRHWDGEK